MVAHARLHRGGQIFTYWEDDATCNQKNSTVGEGPVLDKWLANSKSPPGSGKLSARECDEVVLGAI